MVILKMAYWTKFLWAQGEWSRGWDIVANDCPIGHYEIQNADRVENTDQIKLQSEDWYKTQTENENSFQSELNLEEFY